MAELSLKKITERLNEEFADENRKLVFWYDDKGEFAQDIPSLQLENAKVYYLQPDNQFETKIFLERVDTQTSYLIYAPFPKPDVRDNHLEDTLLYSQRFYADKASLLCLDLGISETFRPLIEKHLSFFASKERAKSFAALQMTSLNEETITTGMICALCKTRTASFEEAVRVIVTEDSLSDNKYLAKLEKFGLMEAFWKLCRLHFGYSDENPGLEKFVLSLFVTAASREIEADLPHSWKPYVLSKSGSAITFLDSIMNSTVYNTAYDRLSANAAKRLHVKDMFQSFDEQALVHTDTFEEADTVLMTWITNCLLARDTGATLDGLSITEICDQRSSMHFGKKHANAYALLKSAAFLVQTAGYTCPDKFEEIVKQYQNEDYKIDSRYRAFYMAYDSLDNTESFESLRDLVENIYTNVYLAKLLPKWNAGLQQDNVFDTFPLQRNFYPRFVAHTKEKEKTVVIISDAMRYEVGKQLLERMQSNAQAQSELHAQLSALPSITRLGMASLLPHNKISVSAKGDVLADDVLCNDLASRQVVLNSHCPKSLCVQFDELSSMKGKELRAFLKEYDVVYIYHNQIDARGDKVNTENEVFTACNEAVEEIAKMMERLSANANRHRFIVTADHGFIYKRDKVTESDKISMLRDRNAIIARRYLISDEPVLEDGVHSLPFGKVLRNEDNRFVSFPSGSNVFKVAGGGQNFVHGGSSPQEMLVPVLDIKISKYLADTSQAQIQLLTSLKKITNKTINLDFFQADACSETILPASYRMYFIAEDGEHISNENTFEASITEEDSAKRIKKLKFQFKDKKYDNTKEYFLIIEDVKSGMEVARHSVIMDLAFSDDFGFGF